MINALKIYKEIEKEYLDFILTTLCRDNKKLKEDFKKFLIENKSISTDIIISEMRDYKKIKDSDLSNIPFCNQIVNNLKEDITKNKIPYVHQLKSWERIMSGCNCIVSTGTGSGKTESFFYPVIDYCLKSNKNGIHTIIIYPTKALASDHARRLGNILDKINEKERTNIKFGLFDGETDNRNREEFDFKSEYKTKEEIISNPPHILMTNYVMLERLLINPDYKKLFIDHKIKFIVLDEIHYYRGSQGIDVSLLMRRLQFHLGLDNKTQYIGTSATIGECKFAKVNDFLYRLFNSKFIEEDIIKPEYEDKEDKINLSKPEKIVNLIKANNLSLDDFEKALENSKNLRAHIFFQSPPDMYRCLDCGSLYLSELENCHKCNSGLVFPILTCRQCGEEYFNYKLLLGSGNEDITIKNISINPILKWDKIENALGELVFSLVKPKSSEANNSTLDLCKKCGTIYKDLSSECPICQSKDKIQVYLPQRSTDNIKFNEQTNNKFCSACEFSERKRSLIVPTGNLSDENCSHVVFDEFFMALPESNRKILIFADSVQNSSKFARELEETHLKNIVRAKLENTIKNLNEPIKLNELVHTIIDDLKESFTINNPDLQKSILIELYEEILSNEKKVASLANRDKIKISFDLSNVNMPDSEKIEVIEVLKIMKDHLQISDYYNLISETGDFTNFEDRTELFKSIYRKLNNEGKKRVTDNAYFDFSKIILDKMCKSNLTEFDPQNKIYFIKQSKIIISSSKGKEMDNYYENWSKRELRFMRTANHTAKTDREERERIEQEFKKEDSKEIDIVVATPTLELGIDIGTLDAVGLLYAPPSPANYVQRVGRSGRRGNSALSVCFLGNRPVDGTYFREPESLVLGEINPPPFKINTETPQKKSVFSVLLHELLTHTEIISVLGNMWRFSKVWKNKKEIINQIIEKNRETISKGIDPFIKLSSLEMNSKSIIKEWLDLFLIYSSLQDSLNFQSKEEEDIFSFLRDAGLLPDYAFGSGGVFIIPTNPNFSSFDGFNLSEACPPSTLDKDKIRFKCERISLRENHIKKISPQSYYQCFGCGRSVSFNTDMACDFCGSLLENKNRILIDPRVIYAKKSSFSLNRQRVDWDYSFINLLQIQDKTSLISKTISGNVLKYAKGYKDGTGKKHDLKICQFCGYAYSSNSEQCKSQLNPTKRHKEKDCTIGESFKSRIIVINLNSLNLIPDKTLLNTLIAALTIKSGCEDGEIGGVIINETNQIVLFDDVEGGVGFVDYLSEYPLEILEEAKKLCEQKECCEKGCIKCIGSYWHQWDIPYLDKTKIIEPLNKMIESIKSKSIEE